jgi:L-asparaginase
MSVPRVALLSMGGTIASLPTGDAAAGVLPRLDAADIASIAGDLGEVAALEPRSVRQLPAASFTFVDILALRDAIRDSFAEGVDGVVVTQGTDNIEETSFAIDLLVDDDRPVVFTGAMRNPSLVGADGPANVRAAVMVAASPQARGLGALVVMNDDVHAARFVRKTDATSPSAFTSPRLGPLGVVVEDQLRLFARVEPVSIPGDVGDVPPVALVRCTLGDDGRVISALRGLGYHGLVIEAIGGGHVAASMVDPLSELAESMPVVLASRTGSGVVLSSTYGFVGSEIDLLGRGLIGSGALDGLKARVALSLALAIYAERRDVEECVRGIVTAVG